MFGSVGIIPAAGYATRMDGCQKELLFAPDGITLLHRTYQTMDMCDVVIVVTRPESIEYQMKVLPPRAVFIQQNGMELIGAVKTALQLEAHEYCFAMPDTYYPDNVFDRDLFSSLSLGLFSTDKPERFGVYENRYIRDKDTELVGTQQKAWGVLMWDDDVADLWRNQPFRTFSQALNHALQKYEHTTFNMDYYYDMATFEDYKEFLCSWH